MDSLSPSETVHRENFFSFNAAFQSAVNECEDVSAKEFLETPFASEIRKTIFTVQEDDSSVKIGAPIYQSEGNIQINKSNTTVAYTTTEEAPTDPEQENFGSTLTPADIIRDIFLGRHTWVGRFRELSKKRELLTLSLQTHDPNTIYSVLWYLKQTLTNEVLMEVLNNIPNSQMYYYTLLQKKGLEGDLIAATHACSDYEKCGLLKLKQARRSSDPYKQLLMMKESESYFKKFGLAKLGEFVADEYELLDAQLSIHEYEKSKRLGQDGICGIEIFSPVLRTPNYTTLYYLCLQHFDSTHELSSPTNFQSRFNIPNAHFLWIVISARSQLKDWPCVDAVLKKYQTKSWFGISKTSALVIPAVKIVEIFYQKDPIPWGESGRELRDSLLVTLLNQTEDLEDRYLWSYSFLCHPVAIDTLVKLKSKKRLEDYIDEVPPFSKYRKQIGDKLASKTIQWNLN